MNKSYLEQQKGLQSLQEQGLSNYITFATAFTIVIFLRVVVKSCRFADYHAKVIWLYPPSFPTPQDWYETLIQMRN
jgi:hypothetical protein